MSDNKALTLEQLREMNGQPVWVEEINHWALIDIETGGRWSGIPFVVWAENGAKFCYNIKAALTSPAIPISPCPESSVLPLPA